MYGLKSGIRAVACPSDEIISTRSLDGVVSTVFDIVSPIHAMWVVDVVDDEALPSELRAA